MEFAVGTEEFVGFVGEFYQILCNWDFLMVLLEVLLVADIVVGELFDGELVLEPVHIRLALGVEAVAELVQCVGMTSN